MVSKINNISRLPIVDNQYSEEQISNIINNFVANETKVQSGSADANLLDFFPLVQDVIKTQEESDVKNLTRSSNEVYRRLLVLEDDPIDPIDTEAITWTVKARVPGRFDQGPSGQGRIKEVVPHLRANRKHAEHPNERLLTYGKTYGNWIEFSIYARDKKTALGRVIWFEKAMDRYSWYFRFKGFRVIEEGMGDRESVEIKGLKLIKYPLTYFVRSEDIYHVTSQELKRISISTTASQ